MKPRHHFDERLADLVPARAISVPGAASPRDIVCQYRASRSRPPHTRSQYRTSHSTDLNGLEMELQQARLLGPYHISPYLSTGHPVAGA
eukprot:2232100-Rhodomonas_salina.1